MQVKFRLVSNMHKDTHGSVNRPLSQPIPNIHVVGIYRWKTTVTFSQLIDALTHLHNIGINITLFQLLGGFNIVLMQSNTKLKAQTRYPITSVLLTTIHKYIMFIAMYHNAYNQQALWNLTTVIINLFIFP